jgi:hypothetical protein
MPTKSNVQYTVRGIPKEVDQALRKKAHQRKVILNRLLIEELTSATGAAPGRKLRSLQGIAGKWREDPEFDRALQEQRQIDWSAWR